MHSEWVISELRLEGFSKIRQMEKIGKLITGKGNGLYKGMRTWKWTGESGIESLRAPGSVRGIENGLEKEFRQFRCDHLKAVFLYVMLDAVHFRLTSWMQCLLCTILCARCCRNDSTSSRAVEDRVSILITWRASENTDTRPHPVQLN